MQRSSAEQISEPAIDGKFGAIRQISRIVRFSLFTHARFMVAILLAAIASAAMFAGILTVMDKRPPVALAAAAAPPRILPQAAAKGDRLPPPVLAQAVPVAKVLESQADGSTEKFAYHQVKIGANKEAQARVSAGHAAAFAQRFPPLSTDPFQSILTEKPAKPKTTAMPVALASLGEERILVRGTPVNVSTAKVQPAPAVEQVVALPAQDGDIGSLLAAANMSSDDRTALQTALTADNRQSPERIELLLEKAPRKDVPERLLMARLFRHDSPPSDLARDDGGILQQVSNPRQFERLAHDAHMATADTVSPDTSTDDRALAAEKEFPAAMQQLEKLNVPAHMAGQILGLAKENGIKLTDAALLDQSVELVFRTNEKGDSEPVAVTFNMKDKTKRFYHYRAAPGNKAEFFDEDGQSASKTLMKNPVPNGRLGDGFAWRTHPILKVRKHHNGVDYAAPFGSPILAAGDGEVVLISSESGYGKYVRIKHDGGFFTTYSHISRTPPSLKVGQRVSQGQVIAYIGSTGLSTGPHLYYELRIGDKYYDPTATPLPAGTDLEGTRLSDFRKQISHVENIENYIGARIATAFAPRDDGQVHTAIH
ncbi:M23 family metallopeptidase [Phyllobacterium myrsinacearum]|uniref:Murein DD-endopeptidase MepM/ murein hydrolase activator NlpD n=1 Tax=Phyllobacterium myrsinacearum TaxID=28101 RepID=A0A839EKI2_9HYPH|nr:M23 family metallopeptidase [Phyllobacterium myrsinacearum]MBA8877230.1 murein DD-endopeptidase MepM/ murein hydrolase activator NlpD [Phyllobacterium myrsinacearum]